MTMIEWDESYSVGVGELDDQHKVLFRMIDKLLEVPDARTGSKIITDVLSEMRAYTSYHFESEEKYMSECAYPDLEGHVRQHEYFCKKVDELLSNITGQQDVLLSDMTNFLYNWLSNHILGSDKKYAPYLIARHEQIRQVSPTAASGTRTPQN